jgi:pyruvate/2-oxoglutarate/acetoin dehydrogenase E1 component
MTERMLRYSEAINEAIRQEMQRDPMTIIMGEDIAGAAGRAEMGLIDAWGGPWRATKGLIKEFGDKRVLDTPISELGFIGAAVGAAMSGLRPIVELMMVDFIGVSYDQVLNQAAKMRYMTGGQTAVPLTIRTAFGMRADPSQGRGGGSAAQHSQTLFPIFVHVPGLKVVAPSDAYTAKGLMTAAIRDDDPVIVMDHKFLQARQGPVPEEPYEFPIGTARVLRPGKDITLAGMSMTTHTAMQAAEMLTADGIDAEVIDLLSLAPVDTETLLASLARTHRMIIVDESHPRCSVARDIAATMGELGFDYLDAPIMSVTAPNTPIPFSAVLENEYVPTPEKVADKARQALGLLPAEPHPVGV